MLYQTVDRHWSTETKKKKTWLKLIRPVRTGLMSIHDNEKTKHDHTTPMSAEQIPGIKSASRSSRSFTIDVIT